MTRESYFRRVHFYPTTSIDVGLIAEDNEKINRFIRDTSVHLGRPIDRLPVAPPSSAKPLKFPAIFCQLDGVKMTTISRGVQHGEGILRLRHATRALRSSDQDTYTIEAASYLALQAWKGGPVLTGLDRIGLYPDPNHGALEVVISEYHIKYTDATKLNSQVRLTKPIQEGISGETIVALALD